MSPSRRVRQPFPESHKIKMLLWCDRHCCLCDKACGTDIEIAHIDQKGPGVIDNAIPLCYNCHARIGHYNREHPRGNKYKPEELKARREQIYEKYTRNLVPPIDYTITQDLPGGLKRTLPDVGFTIMHLGDSLPVQVLVTVKVFLDGKDVGPPASDLYSGDRPWNLNPRHGVRGHFDVPQVVVESSGRLEIKVTVSVVDQYERRHNLLPFSWIFMREENAWFAHPVPTEG